MEKPLILVPCEHGFDNDMHMSRFVLNKSYAQAVTAGGGVPFMPGDPHEAERYADLADGMLLTGGSGVHPALYGDVFFDDDSIKGSNAVRDEMEMKLLQCFVERKKPVMGICRGHQLMNVFFGGKLIQNFPKQLHLEHQNGIAHLVKAEPDSIVGRLFGAEFMTNSHHRDGVTDTGSDILITAKSADGIPEAIEHRTLPCFGVQWHPERQRGDSMNPSCGPDMTPLFTYFVNLCRKGN